MKPAGGEKNKKLIINITLIRGSENFSLAYAMTEALKIFFMLDKAVQ